MKQHVPKFKIKLNLRVRNPLKCCLFRSVQRLAHYLCRLCRLVCYCSFSFALCQSLKMCFCSLKRIGSPLYLARLVTIPVCTPDPMNAPSETLKNLLSEPISV